MADRSARMAAPSALERRSAALVENEERRIFERTDRVFAVLMTLQWLAGVVAAFYVSPRTWAGATSGLHVHVVAALALGGAISFFPVLLACTRPGRSSTRHVIAIGQMLTSALLIHLTGGRIETHFHVFGSLAFLAFYRDWRVLVSASIVVAADHFLRGFVWPQSVYGVAAVEPWRWLEHAGWVVFEDFWLTISILQSRREMKAIADRQANLETVNERIESEVLERTAALRASEERFRSLSASSPIGIFQTDVDGRCIYVNPRWMEITGVSFEDALGDGWSRGIDVADRAAVLEYWRATAAAGLEASREFRIVTPDGQERWVNGRSAPLRRESGRLVGHVGTLEDVTAHRIALARAQESDRLKSAFVANMSHEIRTPLNIILGYNTVIAEELAGRPELETCAPIIAGVERAGRRLIETVHGILDISKIETGAFVVSPEPIDVASLAATQLEDLRVLAKDKGLRLRCDLEVPHATVLFDPYCLSNALTNLLQNAIKFTDAGEVSVRVYRGTDGALRLDVADTGIGIEESYLSRLFAPFSQEDASACRRFEGAGLGLALTKEYIELNDATISVRSRKGEGTTFTIEFSPDAEEAATLALVGVDAKESAVQ